MEMSVQQAFLGIPREEFSARVERLRAHLEAEGLAGAVLFDPAYVLYYTGFAFIPTERPIAFVLSATGRTALFVPRLEREHAESSAHVERVEHYDEYPGETHPMHQLVKLLESLGMAGRVGAKVGADEDGYPWVLGYRGPRLGETLNAEVRNVRPFVEAQMAVKSEREIALLRESAKWANLAHRLLQRYTRVGASETEVSARASLEATRAMLDALGPLYKAQSPWASGARAGYRGQIGRKSAIPHAMAGDLTFRPGDVLVTGATAPVWGYHAELERTLIVGEPTPRQRELFEHMLALQRTAFEALEPGARCADVDRAVRSYYEKHGLMGYWRHHVGHAIGLRYHEGPFLDVGDETAIEPGMVFTVEPGLYDPEIGGFRHSDTVVVTDDGIEILTHYPRDLESLIVPC